jgi:hypothetical protein
MPTKKPKGGRPKTEPVMREGQTAKNAFATAMGQILTGGQAERPATRKSR